MHAEATAHCAAAADSVWAVLSDVESWPTWTSTMVRVEVEDEFAVGGRVLVVQPATRPVVWTIEHIAPGLSFRWHSRGPGFRMTTEYALSGGADRAGDGAAPGTERTPTDEPVPGTAVAMSVAVTGPMAWAVALIAGRSMRRYLAEQAQALAARCAAPA
jgi:hypothetical protein